MFLGTRWKAVTSIAAALSIGIFLTVVPSLRGAGIAGLAKLSIYHLWTLAVLLIATYRVRSLMVGSIVRYWLVGVFAVFMVTYFGAEQIGAGDTATWSAPVIYAAMCGVVFAAAIYFGRRVWRHPGLSDLMVLGFAIGAGFEFHAAGASETVTASGFKANVALLAPSIVQSEGLFWVGPAVWTSLLGLAVGLLVLHRHHAIAAVGAAFMLVLLFGDLVSLHRAPAGSFDFMRQLVFNGKLIGVLFLGGVVVAVLLDYRRLAQTAARDHLFPSERSHGARVVSEDGMDDDLLKPVLAGRYRRLRNGMHNTADATTHQWPPRAETHPAPLAELARLGRAAAVAVGPGTSSSGWAADPEYGFGHRFVGPFGFTAYAASDADTSAEISTPKARREAEGHSSRTRASDYWQYLGLSVVAVALFVLVRLLTAGDPTVIESIGTNNLAGLAETSPAVIRGSLGAVAAAVALRGRNAAQVGPGTEVGPGDDPAPSHPAECKA